MITSQPSPITWVLPRSSFTWTIRLFHQEKKKPHSILLWFHHRTSNTLGEYISPGCKTRNLKWFSSLLSTPLLFHGGACADNVRNEILTCIVKFVTSSLIFAKVLFSLELPSVSTRLKRPLFQVYHLFSTEISFECVDKYLISVIRYSARFVF